MRMRLDDARVEAQVLAQELQRELASATVWGRKSFRRCTQLLRKLSYYTEKTQDAYEHSLKDVDWA